MKQLATVIAAIALIGTPAFAAPPAPVSSWTGLYVGGNVGYGWGSARTDLAGSGAVTTMPQCCAGPSSFTSNFGFADSNTARLSGIIGGAQIGYNFQPKPIPRWILGFEADIQGTGERGAGAFSNSFSTPVCWQENPLGHCSIFLPLQGASGSAYEASIGWFGTVRGRLGYLLTNQLLLYGTGGLAFGQVKVSGNSVLSSSTSCGFCAPTFQSLPPFGTAFDASKTNIGFSAGAGIEGNFSAWLPANWTWKLEYLYVNLGSLDVAAPFAVSAPNCNCFADNITTGPTGTIHTRTYFTDNILRVGLNYRFH